MKGLILKLVTWVIAVFMIIGMGSVATEAFEYLGEFCWHATEEGDPDSFILKLGVFHMELLYCQVYQPCCQNRHSLSESNVQLRNPFL